MGCGIKRIITINDAISTSEIHLFDNELDITNLSLYSWSVDGVCWTGWNTYQNYVSIAKNIESDFYLRILISTGLSCLYIDNHPYCNYSISVDSTSVFLKSFCEETNLFQPYNNLDCAMQLQQQLADSVVCMFGIPIYYFRCDPNPESADYTFKEYILHNVVAVKQLKLMIKDGQMPSSNPKLTEFDFDWETDWETELSKAQFATAFGDNAIPKYGDFIYIPMMQRMWDVNAAYDEKNEGLMWRSTTWKLQLVKYSDSTAYNEGEFESFIDTLIPKTYENTFGQLERIEQERETGKSQLTTPMFAATNLYDIFMEDAIRKQYTENDISILSKQYNHRANVVSKNIYKFKGENGCITYQKGICGEDGTLAFIIETPGSLKDNIKRDIIQFGNLRVNIQYDGKFYLSINENLSAELEAFKSYMCVVRWSRSGFITDFTIYAYKHREDVPIYKLRPEMYWFDFENPIYFKSDIYNNDLYSEEELPCQIHAYPLQLTNIKYYDSYLDNEQLFKEIIKYTTTENSCIINDLARQIYSGHGYAVK